MKLDYYIEVSFHDTDKIAGYQIQSFDVESSMTAEEIGRKIKASIEYFDGLNGDKYK